LVLLLSPLRLWRRVFGGPGRRTCRDLLFGIFGCDGVGLSTDRTSLIGNIGQILSVKKASKLNF
jgi:hypothetical protein